MELMHPIVVVICLILAIAICFIKFTKKREYSDGKKVANTIYIKQTNYYKEKVKKYKILTNLIKGLLVFCIVISSVLIARPISIQSIDDEEYNRDIILGLDVSGSQDEINYELIRKFKEIIPSIKGDRIGIVIFNTAPLVYCPLTDDYDYIKECLDNIEKAIKIELDKDNGIYSDSYDSTTILYGGINAGSETKGSSLVGDGLAGTLYSFPEVKENDDRTRIIIFATDNDVAGTETITLDEACALCKKYKIKLYAHSPTSQMNVYATPQKISEYRNAVESIANGKFYTGDLEKSLSAIVGEIKTTKTTQLRGSKKTQITDYPEVFLVTTFILFVAIICLEKKI